VVHREVDLTEDNFFSDDVLIRLSRMLPELMRSKSICEEIPEWIQDPVVYLGSPLVCDDSLPFYIGIYYSLVWLEAYREFLLESGIIGEHEYCFRCGRTIRTIDPHFSTTFCHECERHSVQQDLLKKCTHELERSDGMFWLESIQRSGGYVV
jgi:hypothetical protein